MKAVKKGEIRYNKKLWEGIDLKLIKMEKDDKWPNGYAYDVFKDGTVYFVDLAGHSRGMSGVYIKNGSNFVLITGDAVYNRHNYEDLKLPGLVVDKEKAIKSINRILKLSKYPGCIAILPSHDIEIKPHTIKL